MVYAIVPVKPLPIAKGRLADILTPAERRALVLAMIEDVLRALRAARAIDGIGVVSRDGAVLALAEQLGAERLHDHAGDLNGALTRSAAYYQGRGATAALVLPADVPLVAPEEIDRLIGAGRAGAQVVLAPSRDGGTNALYLRPPTAMPFQFGPESRARHLEAARALELAAQTVRSPGLELDIDRPEDLLLLAESEGATAAQRLVRELNIGVRLACISL